METLMGLRSKNGRVTNVCYDFRTSVQELTRQAHIDAYLVASESGYSPLGAATDFLAENSGFSRSEIIGLADWNRFKNDAVTLIACKSRKQGSLLKGFILCPGENSTCYERFATPRYESPYRDFYYNVVYQAISYAAREWGAEKPAISHLTGSGNFREDVALCTGEALGHFVDGNPNHPIESFGFIGCCIELDHIKTLTQLNPEGRITTNRPIFVQEERVGDIVKIHIDWTV